MFRDSGGLPTHSSLESSAKASRQPKIDTITLRYEDEFCYVVPPADTFRGATEFVLIKDLQLATSQKAMKDHTSIKISKRELIGQGAFSDVYDCLSHLHLPLQASTQQHPECPLSVMKVHRFNSHRFKTKESKIRCVEREAYALYHARHPNVIPLIGSARMNPEDVPALVFPKMQYDLLSYIEAHQDTCPFSLILPIAEAVAHVHKCGMIHRDIKPGNILVHSDGTVYLADFGSCQMDSKQIVEDPSDGACTIDYAAPEILFNQRATQASDVFSFGIVANQIFGGGKNSYPKWMRPGAVVLAVCNRKERPEHPVDADPTVCRIFAKCWAHNPLDRPTMPEVLQELKVLRDAKLASSAMAN